MTNDRAPEDQYIGVPTEEHRRASAARLVELAATLTEATVAHRSSRDQEPAQRTLLRVRLCHFKQNHLLSPLLHSFSLAAVDAKGESVDVIAEGGEVTFGIVLNHPVEVQIRAAISVIAELVTRQSWISRIQRGEAEIHTVDRDVELLDREADAEIEERLRFGWSSAATALVRSAIERGYELQCRYTPDLLVDGPDVNSRVPIFSDVYNSRADLRAVIDKTVGLVGSGRIAGAGGAEAMRDLAQRSMTLWNVRRHMNHSFRDALVCGNGYMVVDAMASPPVRNLSPAKTRIMAPGRYAVRKDDGSEEHFGDGVVHLRGVEQLNSPYGISALEPFLPHMMTLRALDRAAGAARQMLQARPRPAQQILGWAEATLEQRDRVDQAVLASVTTLIAPFVTKLSDAPSDLYFDGYELM